jgi:hypothetical protein
MKQSLITKYETLEKIVAHAQRVIGRKLTESEEALINFALEQIRLGLVK